MEHLTAILPDNTRILLITLDYDGSERSGPPFNVSDEEVFELYSGDFEVEHIVSNTLAADHPFCKIKA